MKKILLGVILTVVSVSTIFSQEVKAKLDKFENEGKAVYLVITDDSNSNTEELIQKAEKAKESVKAVEVVTLNRDKKSNTELVSKYGIESAPLPLILVIASNGVVAGGFTLTQVSTELLINSIPSPKKAEVLKVISEGKSIFLVVSSKKMEKKSSLVGTCQQACIEMERKAKVIEIDLDDKLESSFLTELKIDQSITEPATYVINAKGQITGSFNGDVNTTTLIASATKTPKSSCCPPNSGKSCEPKKK